MSRAISLHGSHGVAVTVVDRRAEQLVVLGRYAALTSASVIGQYTVLPAGSGCTTASKASAAASNSPAAILSAALAPAAAAQAAQLAAMKARLDAVQPLLQALMAEPPPSLTITGLATTNPVVWQSTPQQVLTIPRKCAPADCLMA